MVITAKLHIKGHKQEQEGISLLNCSYGFTQDVDQRGMTKTDVKGGVITMTYYSWDDEEIMHWMLTQMVLKDGRIEFSRDDEDGKVFKTLEFTDALCVSFHETFLREGILAVELVISARVVKISNAEHKNLWTGFE